MLLYAPLPAAAAGWKLQPAASGVCQIGRMYYHHTDRSHISPPWSIIKIDASNIQIAWNGARTCFLLRGRSRTQEKENKDQRCCDRKGMSLSAQLKSDCGVRDGRKRWGCCRLSLNSSWGPEWQKYWGIKPDLSSWWNHSLRLQKKAAERKKDAAACERSMWGALTVFAHVRDVKPAKSIQKTDFYSRIIDISPLTCSVFADTSSRFSQNHNVKLPAVGFKTIFSAEPSTLINIFLFLTW